LISTAVGGWGQRELFLVAILQLLLAKARRVAGQDNFQRY
jgi:hypothetical protein